MVLRKLITVENTLIIVKRQGINEYRYKFIKITRFFCDRNVTTYSAPWYKLNQEKSHKNQLNFL